MLYLREDVASVYNCNTQPGNVEDGHDFLDKAIEAIVNPCLASGCCLEGILGAINRGRVGFALRKKDEKAGEESWTHPCTMFQ